VGSYTNFYLRSTTVAGALAGLLFVALSVAPQAAAWRPLSVEQQAVLPPGTEITLTLRLRARVRPPSVRSPRRPA
jgi:hypothetical protein